MKSIILLSSMFLLTGCIVDPYYGNHQSYNYTETSTYIPSGSTMIYTERTVTPQFYYRETYPVYIDQPPRYYKKHRPYYNNKPHYYRNKPRNER